MCAVCVPGAKRSWFVPEFVVIPPRSYHAILIVR